MNMPIAAASMRSSTVIPIPATASAVIFIHSASTTPASTMRNTGESMQSITPMDTRPACFLLKARNSLASSMDTFLVFDEDLSCGEMWEINPKTREQFDDDTIADMIVNLAEKDFPDDFVWCVTAVVPMKTLFN